MSGGMPLLRNRRLAAGFIIVMYVMLGALLTGLLVAGFSDGNVGKGVAVVVGGALGAAFGVWRIRRTPENEREDDGGY
ncbi:hypothetical protein [Streptomyces sp. NPDC058401]|uniref:hypothetical protein n=1 Tax=Streptomyces sp. NPDC058401 TaxID=3346480 RepID=UPI003648A65D